MLLFYDYPHEKGELGMTRLFLSLTAAAGLVLAPTVARVQQAAPGTGIADLIKKIQAAKATTQKLRDTEIGQKQNADNAKKEMRVFADQEKKILIDVQPQVQKYQQDMAKVEAQKKKYKAAQKRTEDRCRGADLPAGVHQRCTREKEQHKGWRARIEADEKRALKIMAAVTKRITPVMQGIVGARKKLKQATSEYEKARKLRGEWEAHLKILQAQLHKRCQFAKTCEERRYCRSFRWDGTAPGLPPLPRDHPAFRC